MRSPEALLECLNRVRRDTNLSVNGHVLARYFAAQTSLAQVNDTCFPQRTLLVVSPPRTGTTYLQALLNSLPHNRTIHGWQCVGDPTEPRCARVERRAANRAHLGRLVPGLIEHHPIAITGPEELNQLGSRTGVSLTHLTIFGLRPFLDVLGRADAYTGHGVAAALLNELGRDNSAKYHVFKCPELFHRMGDARRLFPNATLVQIVRPLGLAMDSWRRLLAATQQHIYSSGLPNDDDWETFFIPDAEPDHQIDFERLCHHPMAVVRELDELMTGRDDHDLSPAQELVDLVAAVRPTRKNAAGVPPARPHEVRPQPLSVDKPKQDP